MDTIKKAIRKSDRETTCNLPIKRWLEKFDMIFTQSFPMLIEGFDIMGMRMGDECFNCMRITHDFGNSCNKSLKDGIFGCDGVTHVKQMEIWMMMMMMGECKCHLCVQKLHLNVRKKKIQKKNKTPIKSVLS